MSSMKEFIKLLPKAELHLHLEGAIPLQALWQLLEKYNAVSEVGSIEGLQNKFRYKDFSSFINTWVWKNSFLREYEDFEFIAQEVAKDLKNQNIRYCEAFYSPGDFARHGLHPQLLTSSIRKGLNKVDGIEINLVADLIRDFGPLKGEIWLKQIEEVKDQGVIGIGIGGSEYEFPPTPYKRIYQMARKMGFKCSAHAGEAAGATSIWDSINELHVDRIGHGTRAIEDANLVNLLKEKRIPIEMCPISNLRTGVVKDIHDHPVKTFVELGLFVSINTDDPKMFNNSLEEEYLLLVETFGWGKKEVSLLAHNAIDSSWATERIKENLRDELDQYLISSEK